jgi:hypothetical protein
MKLVCKVEWIRRLAEEFDSERLREMVGYSRDEQFDDVVTQNFTDQELERLQQVGLEAAEAGEKRGKALADKIMAYKRLRANPTGQKVGTLQGLVTALTAYIEPSEHRWLFKESADGVMLPYVVTNIEYHAPEKDSPASVDLEMQAYRRGSGTSGGCSFGSSDIAGRTAVEILQRAGMFLETPEMVEEYLATVERFNLLSPQTGEQFSATGLGFLHERSWGRYQGERVALEREGAPTTVVMDDQHEESDRNTSRDATTVYMGFWSGKPRKSNRRYGGEEVDEALIAALPVHPYVKVFDLAKHEFLTVHVANLTEYVYDKTLIEKLVLPAETKDLVGILVQGSTESLEDIVRGKMPGVIVLATGKPGTGKTLTAEVFSEEVERALYVVQCSQLGTNEAKLEERLMKVLERAARWKAILLIDEADVYIRARGDDIQQNAIVGVFLRVLEYYRGILFMTSNRATIIDDAIMSRATAHVRYPMPDAEALERIWKILGTQFKIRLTEDAIDELVEAYPQISGRNVRSLLKLAKLLANKRKEAVKVETIKFVSAFIDLDGGGDGN